MSTGLYHNLPYNISSLTLVYLTQLFFIFSGAELFIEFIDARHKPGSVTSLDDNSRKRYTNSDG